MNLSKSFFAIALAGLLGLQLVGCGGRGVSEGVRLSDYGYCIIRKPTTGSVAMKAREELGKLYRIISAQHPGLAQDEIARATIVCEIRAGGGLVSSSCTLDFIDYRDDSSLANFSDGGPGGPGGTMRQVGDVLESVKARFIAEGADLKARQDTMDEWRKANTGPLAPHH